MSAVTRILSAIDAGDTQAADQLLPLVYDELRRLAAQQMARETPGNTLEPTALVHEAYMRLVGSAGQPQWQGQAHFYAVAAESMRRILIEAARRKKTTRHGGGNRRADLDPELLASPTGGVDILAIDEALEKFAEKAPEKAKLVKLRYYAGCTIGEAARLLGISPREADRWWVYAKSWLKLALQDSHSWRE